MWADTVLSLESGYCLRFLAWSASSIIAGTLVFLWLARRSGPQLVMLRAFALQCLIWGSAELIYAYYRWHGLGLRDFAGVQRLLAALWLISGFSIATVVTGVALAVVAVRYRQSARITGLSLGLLVQGTVLTLSHLGLIASIGPIQ